MQLEWLQTQLTDARNAEQKVIVLAHHPVATIPGHESLLLWNAQAVRGVLAKAGCVAAYLSGHDHEGAYVYADGIHHLTVPGMVEAPTDGNRYAVVDVFHDHLDFHGSMSEYLAAKLHLLDLRKQGGIILAGTGCSGFPEIPGSLTFGDGDSDDYRISDVSVELKGASFKLSSPGGESAVRIGIPGRINVLNSAGAIAACMETGSSIDDPPSSFFFS